MLEDWSLVFAGASPAAAYRVNDKWSLGLSLSIDYSRYKLEKAVFSLDPAAADGSFELTADGWGVGAILRALYEPSARTRCGLVYRSKVSVTDKGSPSFPASPKSASRS